MAKFAFAAIFLSAALLSPSLPKPNHILFGVTERLSWSWTGQFNKHLSVPSGVDFHKTGRVQTYVCRVSWDAPHSDIRVGKYSPESNCCSYTRPDKSLRCVRPSFSWRRDNPKAKVQFLAKPIGQRFKEAQWIPAADGVVDPNKHWGLILGGMKAFVVELVCRFEYTVFNQTFVLQGNIAADQSVCLAPFGFIEQPNGEAWDNQYELLVFV